MNFEKPYKTKAQAKKGSFDHKWPGKRSSNIEQMIKRMQKDKAYLFEVTALLLSNYSDIAWKLGDENMSILISWAGAQMTSMQWKIEDELKRQKAVKKAKRLRR